MRPGADDDATVRLRAGDAPRPRGPRWGLIGAAALVLAAGLAGGGWYAWQRPDPAPPPVQAVVPAPVLAPPVADAPVVATSIAGLPRPMTAPFAPKLATEADILADAPEAMQVYRFALQPSIVVLQFPTLAEQGRALNRVAALIEKNGFPRDRVLPDAELNGRIRASGGDPDTFYYGHDYRASDLMRFYALAAAQNVALTPEEVRLRDLAGKLGWGGPDTRGALISLVRQDMAAGLDSKARATILRHELSHGVYFTTPDYVAYVHQFWDQVLTARERAAFTNYLANDGYDPALPDLIVNETQAYLMHTADPRFFNAAGLGMSEARLASLRLAFLSGMPPSWLRDCTVLPPAPASVIPVRAPRRRPPGNNPPRPPQRRGLVRTIRTEAERRTRLAAAASRAARNSRR